jgi:hypothetical protein
MRSRPVRLNRTKMSRSSAVTGLLSLAPVAQGDRGVACQLGPFSTGEIGQSQERFPDIGGAVVEFRRKLGPGCSDGLGVVQDEAGALAAERHGVEVSEALTLFGGGFALHATTNGHPALLLPIENGGNH